MSAARILSALASGAARRPWLVVGTALVLALGAGALALGLRPTAATNTLIGRSSATYHATQRFYQRFGDEAVVVLVRGSVKDWVFSQDLERELTMEGCLAGNLHPNGIANHGGASGPCAQLARTRPVKVVFGPGTFINESVAQISDQFNSETQAAQNQANQAYQAVYRAALARHLSRARALTLGQEAYQLILTAFARQLVQTGVRFGITSLPSINDPNFVSKLIFDPLKPVGTPKQRFAYLFPNSDTAIITVRLKPGLSEADKTRAITLIRRAVAMPDWSPQHGESYLVTGEPVIVSDLTGSITHSVKLLLVAVLLVMAATLVLVFRGRPRLLPLATALVATALTFGALAISGASLTMASIGVLPVLIGLAVDYAIQFQSRVEEVEQEVGARPEAGVRRAAALGGPTIATAAAATAGGFLVLVLSPIPMVRGFGLVLVAGIVLAFLTTVTAGSAALVLSRRAGAPNAAGRRRRVGTPAWAGALARAAQSVQASLRSAGRGARELVLENAALHRGAHAAFGQAVSRPARVLGVGLALAALGWALDTQTRVESNIQRLVPQNLASLRNLNTLERQTGVGGEIDVMVGADDLTQPQVVNWMTSYQANLLKRFGYSDSTSGHGCGRAQLCPAFSLPSLFSSTTGSTSAPRADLSQADIRGLLDAVPAYFSQGVITGDRRTATLAFGIRFMPLDQQQRVLDEMRRRLHPPPGVQADLVGLPVLAAQANAEVSPAWRRVVTLLAGLAAVALVLLAAFRGDRRRALVPLVPIVLATGWSALILFAIRVPLNPMSVTMGALVIAISTEFSVLLSERHRQERLAGLSSHEALERTYRQTGAAVLASGATAIVGFAVLVLSDITMLRGFGFVTLIDLTVSLLGVMLVLPSALLLAEHGELLRLPRRWVTGAAARVRAGVRARHEPA